MKTRLLPLILLALFLTINSCKKANENWAEALTGTYTGSDCNNYTATINVTYVDEKVFHFNYSIPVGGGATYSIDDDAMLTSSTEANFEKENVTDDGNGTIEYQKTYGTLKFTGNSLRIDFTDTISLVYPNLPTSETRFSCFANTSK